MKEFLFRINYKASSLEEAYKARDHIINSINFLNNLEEINKPEAYWKIEEQYQSLFSFLSNNDEKCFQEIEKACGLTWVFLNKNEAVWTKESTKIGIDINLEWAHIERLS